MLRRPSSTSNAEAEPTPESQPNRLQIITKVEEWFSRVREYYQRSPRLQRFIWQRKISPAFWTISSLLSLTVNLGLIIILILLGRQLFTLKAIISEGLINGLHKNFVLMDQAHIITTIHVESTIRVVDQIPVVFDLPLSQTTTVVLTRDTEIPNTWVALDTSGSGIYLSINSPADIILPENTALDIRLDLIVPVSQTIPVVLDVPVSLDVPVDIPLAQTELHEPFVGLQNVVSPYRNLLEGLPNSWEETPFCGPLTGWVCNLLFGDQ